MFVARILLPCTALLLAAACASIVEGSTDPVTVATSPVSQPTCVLANARGAWNGAASAPILVKRSRSDLSVSCIDPVQGTSGNATLASDVEGWTFGNILFGGLIGLVVDWSTGAAYTYPDHVTVEMRDSLRPQAELQETPPAPVVPTLAAPIPASVLTPAVPHRVDTVYPQVETVYDMPDAQGAIAAPPVFVVPGRVY